MKIAGIIVILFSVLVFASGINVAFLKEKDPGISESEEMGRMVGAFLPGILVLGIGIILLRKGQRKSTARRVDGGVSGMDAGDNGIE